jgi:transcriptional regulator with XRE-family HTH domain
MTLEIMAERSGLTPNYIGSVEIGKRDPSLSTVLAVAKGLGIQPGELFGSVADLSPTAEEAANLFDQVAPDMQKAVLSLLRTVAVPSPKKSR